MRRFQIGCFVASSLVALSWSSAVLAQTGQPAPAGSTAGQATAESTGGNTVAPATEASSTDDITVTARRREERLTDVPIAVSVLSGNSLVSRGVARVDDLQVATPGLKMAPTAGRRSNSQYELRGITTIESLITEDAAVGIYVDDVYRARATGTNQSFFDIANVQVLYGPQGTLFGRNSTGGAILINSQHPTNQFEGSLEAGYGSLNQYRVTGVLNIPITDNLQVRFAGERVRADGYVTNGSTGHLLGGRDSWAGRASVHFRPTSGIDNLLVVAGYTANDGGTPVAVYGLRSSTVPNAYGQVPALARVPAFVTAVGQTLTAEQQAHFYTTYLDAAGATVPGGGSLVGQTGYLLQGNSLLARDPYERPRNLSVSNTTTFELGSGLSLKNIFGYNYTKLNTTTDLDGTPLALIQTYYETRNNQFSDEIQLSGQGAKFNWVAGGLYFRETGTDFQPALQFVSSFTTTTLRGVNTSIGVFAQGTYKLTDHLNVTAGGRYTWDTREASFTNMLLGSVGTGFVTNGGYGIDLSATSTCGLKPGVADNGPCGVFRKASFRQPSYTVSVDYKPDADTLLYIAHRRGYRSGGFNSRITLTAPAATQLAQASAFRPEILNDVEIGYKGNYRWNDFRLRTSLALFDSWYTDLQKQTTQFIGGTGVTLIQNSGKANVKGAEAELGISPARGVDLDSFASYTDGTYHNFPAPNGTFVADVPFATSKWTAGTTLTLTPMDNSQGRISFVQAISFRSPYYGDNALPTLNPEARVPSQYNVNLTVNWERIAGSRLSASAWVRNATDQVHFLGMFDLVPSFGLAIATIGEPRTFGGSVKFSF